MRLIRGQLLDRGINPATVTVRDASAWLYLHALRGASDKHARRAIAVAARDIPLVLELDSTRAVTDGG